MIKTRKDWQEALSKIYDLTQLDELTQSEESNLFLLSRDVEVFEAKEELERLTCAIERKQQDIEWRRKRTDLTKEMLEYIIIEAQKELSTLITRWLEAYETIKKGELL
jgi:hypothetical protein